MDGRERRLKRFMSMSISDTYILPHEHQHEQPALTVGSYALAASASSSNASSSSNSRLPLLKLRLKKWRTTNSQPVTFVGLRLRSRKRLVVGTHRLVGLAKLHSMLLQIEALAVAPTIEEEATALTECRRCNWVATYQDFCYLHWQERVSVEYFAPEAYAALTSYNLALA